MILASRSPKTAPGRVKHLRNAFGRPKMTLETEKHLENDLFGLKKHLKNTPVLKGDFGSFDGFCVSKDAKPHDFPYLFMKSLDQR